MQKKNSHRFDKWFPYLKGNIFIVTYGRSGSTLLQNLLMTIPECDIRGENHNTIEPLWRTSLRARKALNEWGKIERPVVHPWYGADKIKPNHFDAALVNAFVLNVLCPPKNVRWFGYKEIRYDAFGPQFPQVLNFIRANFKNAYFIFNTRRKEDVANSAWWQNWEREKVYELVKTMDEKFTTYHKTHPSRTEVICYDNYSKNLDALRPVFDKLGEPFEMDKLEQVLNNRLQH